MSLSFDETFDQRKLNYIITNDRKFKFRIYNDTYDPVLVAKKYLCKSKKGVVKTKYNYSKNSDHYGRLFAKDSVSLQNICREIRHAIAKDYYDDLDMVNAHPVILKFVCEENDISCDRLSEYIENREAILKDVIDECDIDRDNAKQIFLSLINSGTADYDNLSNPTKFLKRFKNEMDNTLNNICSIFAQIYESCKKSNPDNPKGSTINRIMCDYENQILQCILQFYKDKGIIKNNCVLCFDGIMIPKNEKIAEHIEECEDYIFENTRIPAKLKIKEMDEGFKLPIDIPEYVEYEPFDVNDSFCFLDFKNKWHEHEFKSEGDMIIMCPDLRRVFCTVDKGSGTNIKKTDCGDDIIDMVDAKQCISSMFFYIVNDKKKEKKKEKKKFTFRQFIESFANDINSYRKFVFEPNNNDPALFNLWRGYQAIEIEEVDMDLIQPMLSHIREVYCDNCDVSYNYFLDLLYYMIKYPERPLGVATFIHSQKQGSGKNIVLDFLQKYVFGNNVSYYTTGLDTILEKHNTILKNKKFVVVDELASSSDNWMGSFDKLKSMMTGNSILINPKGLNQYSIPNLLSWFLVSNHEDCIRIEQSDRRYFCLSVNEKYVGDVDYFKMLSKSSFNQQCGNAFYTFIIDRCKDRDVNIRIPPMNAFKKSIISRGFSTSLRYLYELEGVELDRPEDALVSASDLFERYTWWCSNNREKVKSSTKFFLDIKSYIVKKRTAKGYVYNLNTIDVNGI
jgi:hypothetical protein